MWSIVHCWYPCWCWCCCGVQTSCGRCYLCIHAVFPLRGEREVEEVHAQISEDFLRPSHQSTSQPCWCCVVCKCVGETPQNIRIAILVCAYVMIASYRDPGKQKHRCMSGLVAPLGLGRGQ